MEPLFAMVKSEIARLITSGRYPVGSVLPPVEDLAALSQCSTGTVRRALAELAIVGVVKGVQSKGTMVTKLPEAGRVCLLLSPDPHTNQLLQPEVYWALHRTGYHVDVVPRSGDLQDDLRRCEQIHGGPPGADTLVMLEPVHSSGGWSSLLETAARFPRRVAYAQNNRFRIPGTHLITTDHQQAARVVADHLLGLNHRRIAVVAGFNAQEHSFASDSAQQLRHLLEITGATCFPIYLSGNPDQALYDMITQRGVTAYWDLSDHRATFRVSDLQRRGLRIPDDVSIIGRFDTSWAPVCQPTLTSVSINPKGMAQAILAAVQSPPVDPLVQDIPMTCVAPLLVPRESTGPAPSLVSRKRRRHPKALEFQSSAIPAN